MTILSNNSIFQPIPKFIKFRNCELSVVNGPNVVNNLNLQSVKINYEQFMRTQVQIPAGQKNFLLSFPMLGIKVTHLTIKPTYKEHKPNMNYLRWKFQSDSGNKWSMTNMMMLTATSNNPIPPILIDNPNKNEPVVLDILVAVMTQDYMNDVSAFIYLDNLTFDKVRTFNETNSGILTFFNSADEMVGSVNISDIINISRIPTKNRIVIDESSSNNVVLDFVNDYHTRQALSAINWVIQDAAFRSLPQAPDNEGPVVTFKNTVIDGKLSIDLSLHDNTYTKQNFIDNAINVVTDARDGIIVPQINNIIFRKDNVLMHTIVETGTYTATITAQDIAGNQTTHDIEIDSLAVIEDVNPPVITYSSNVIGDAIVPQDLVVIGEFRRSDAIVLCILGVADDYDGSMTLDNVIVQFFNIYKEPVTKITSYGQYTVRFTVSDTSNNTRVDEFTMMMLNTAINNAPEILFTQNVSLPGFTSGISLSTFGGSFTKSNAISYMIVTVMDDNDGNITVNPADVVFLDVQEQSIATIDEPGTYQVRFTTNDSGGLQTIKTVILTVS
jgi:hypothetical protein